MPQSVSLHSPQTQTTGSAAQPRPSTGSSGRIIPAPRRARLYALDGLRLLAALMVVVFHYTGYNHAGANGAWGQDLGTVFPTLHGVAAYGWLGVEFFFLLSGFVICLSCWGRSVRDFAVSRVVRLFPAFWFCVLLTSAVLRATGDRSITMERVLTNLTMLHEPLGVAHVDPVYWSLWAEMRFYLIFSLVVLMGLTYQRVLAFCAIWLVASVLAPASGIPLLVTLVQPTYAPFFVGGVVIFLMHRFRPSPLLWLVLAASWLLGQHQLMLMVKDQGPYIRVHLSWAVALAIVTACYGLLLAIALGKLGFLNRRWLVTAGALTYPLYLVHEEIGWTLIERLHGRLPSWALLTGLIATMLAAAWLIHRFVERPLSRRLKGWLSTTPTLG